MNNFTYYLSLFTAWISRLWYGKAFLVLEDQLRYEREQQALIQQIQRDRIAELEKQVSDLQDRILLIKGVPPLQYKPPERKPIQPVMPGYERAINEAIAEKDRQRAFFQQQAAQWKQTNPANNPSEIDEIDEIDQDE